MMTRMQRRMTVVAAAVTLALTLSAARGAAQAKVDVTGKWAFNVETSAGAGAPTFTFKQDGEKLTGHYTGTFGEADLTGTVKGADITFSFNVDAQGTAIKEVYTGTVDKDTMKGKLVIEGFGEGTFTAKKQ
jgi:CHASE2 domain-containing sensor protein